MVTPSDPAMAIMEKYASLKKGIDEARNETLRLQEEKENLLSQIEKLHADRSNMEKEEQVAQNEAVVLQEKIKLILKASSQYSSLSSDALIRRNCEERRVNFMNSYMTQQRRDFWEESRNFRSTIKRLKLTSTECGLDTAISHAFLEAHGIDVEAEHVNEETRDAASLPTELLEEKWHEEAMAELPASEEETRNLDYNDPMYQALLSYRRAFKEREEAEHDFNDARIMHKEASDRSLKRRQKQEKLRAQLKSIESANRDLEQEIKDVKEQTLETQALTESYRKRANEKQPEISTSNGRSLLPTNPYSKTQTSLTRQNYKTAVERQHPHLAGRIRMDRQFGVASIGISGGDEALSLRKVLDEEDSSSSDDDNISDFVAFRRN